MPRKERLKSKTDIYHVILRGINRQVIFEEDEDMLRFLQVLKECKNVSGFKVYAYCLMSNHVHLLIRTGTEPLELIIKRIGCRYVYWYNLKYGRSGHLFQDRYRSEVVESEASFLKVLRYILQNPMKAGLENAPGEYKWSSYGSYAGGEDGITDIQMAGVLFNSQEKLLEFIHFSNEDKALDVDDEVRKMIRVTDRQAKEVMRMITGCRSVADFQALEKVLQKKCMRMLRNENLSYGQIARLTGASKTTVYRACV